MPFSCNRECAPPARRCQQISEREKRFTQAARNKQHYAPVATSAGVQPVVARRNDAIAELIGPSARIAAVQRALSEFGYGQIKASGTLDDATSAAIQKFEREHNLASTGRVSDRLIKELAAMIGRPIE